MIKSTSSKLFLALLLLPALLVISFANLCRCVDIDCDHRVLACCEHGEHAHHEHSHHAPLEDEQDDPVPHQCDHSAEPMVQVDTHRAIALLPILAILVDYMGAYDLSEHALTVLPADTSPPLPPSVLIEPYRPLLL